MSQSGTLPALLCGMRNVFSSLLTSVLLGQSFSYAIVRGTSIDSKAHPAVVRLVLSHEIINGQEAGVTSLRNFDRCSGVAISDSEVLTAGHCIVDDNQEKFRSIILVREKQNDQFEIVNSVAAKTTFTPEPIQLETTGNGPVRGCSPRVKPLIKTQTPDLGIVKFKAGTFKTWAAIEKGAKLKVGEQVQYFGYGVHISRFEANYPIGPIRQDDLRQASSTIFRMNDQRIAWVSRDTANFADTGDSGGPVFRNGKVIAILSTASEHCETEFGEDYGIMNTATKL